MLKSNLYSPVRSSSCSDLEVAILAVCATSNGSQSHLLNGTTPCPKWKRFNAVGLPVAVHLWGLGAGAGFLSCPTSSSDEDDGVDCSIWVRPSHSMLTHDVS